MALGTPANEVQSTLSTAFIRGTDSTIITASGTNFPATSQVVRLTDGLKWCLLIYTSKTTDTLNMANATGYALAQNVSSGDDAETWAIGSTVELVWASDYVADLVPKSLFDAQSIIAAVTDDTPAKLTVAEQTLVGRITGGNIDDLSAAQARTLLNVADDADATPAASTTVAGKVELAIASEVNTGTSVTLAVTPDSLAGSYAGRKTVYIKVLNEDATPTVTDGLMHFTVPLELNGMNLIDADAVVKTASSSGLPEFDLYNLTDSADMLSTDITIDATELSSYTATTPPVVDAAHDDVVTGDIIRIDCDVIGTGTKGLDIVLVFGLP